MQQTSATWRVLWAAGARLEARATIAGTEYPLMSAPVITRAAMQGGLSIGNAVSAMCQLSVMAGSATIPKAAPVAVEMRLTDGETVSEWLPAGTFYISRRQRDPVNGILTLECYDALLKANALLTEVPWTTNTGEVVTDNFGEWIMFSAQYPRQMAELLEDILLLLNVELDSRTQIKTGSDYVITTPNTAATIRDLLAKIAAANGGSWIITPAGKLRLVPVVSAVGAATAGDAVDVLAITRGIDVSPGQTITGIRYPTEDIPVVLGDETGIVIEADVNAAVASDLYDELSGMTYQAYRLDGAIYDPAAELGDYLRAGGNGEVASVLYSETATIGALYNADIAAPEAGELSDEYPYIGGSEKVLTAAKVYAAQTVAAYDNTLDQEKIFNRLTNNGQAQGIYISNGQLYVSASYILSGILRLGGVNNGNGVLNILNSSGQVVGTWDNTGLSVNNGAFSVDTSGKLTAGNSELSGSLTCSGTYGATPGEVIIQGGSIRANKAGVKELWIAGSTFMALEGKDLYFVSNYPKLPHASVTIGADGNITVNATKILLYPTANDGGIYVAGFKGVDGDFTTADGKLVAVRRGLVVQIS